MNYRLCFQVYLRRQGRSRSTIKRYSAVVTEYIAYRRSRQRRAGIVKSLSIKHLETYKLYLGKVRRLRPSTINSRLTALSAFARFLILKEQLTYNPLEMVPRIRPDGSCTSPGTASRESVQALRREIHRDLLELPGRVIVELLYAGLSVCEICSLLHDRQMSNERLVLQDRQVNLHSEARLALKHYKILRPLLIGDRLIVGNSKDGVMQPGAVYYLLQRFSKKIGVRVSVRDLRLAQFREQDTAFRAEEAAA